MNVDIDMQAEAWRSIDDRVMGGLSGSRMEGLNGSLCFSGEISLENNGGFASVRRPIEAGLSGARAVRLALRGDGRRYQLRLRMDDQFDGVAWSADFDSSPDWAEVEIPIGAFKPVFRGRPVPGAGGLDPGRIRQLGLMTVGQGEGPFRLEVRAIQFVMDHEGAWA